MLKGESLDIGARKVAAVYETQEPAHLFEAKPKFAGAANESEAAEVFLAVEAMPAVASWRGWHHPDFLVIADGLDVAAGTF